MMSIPSFITSYSIGLLYFNSFPPEAETEAEQIDLKPCFCISLSVFYVFRNEM